MAWTLPATWSSGAILTAAQLNTQLRDNLLAISGAWTAFTTTWSGSLGNGTNTGAYTRIGRTIHFRIHIIWGTTTSHAATSQTVTVPVTANGVYGVGWVFGSAGSYDASVPGIGGPGFATVLGANTLGINGNTGSNFWTNTFPITWAVGDTMYVTGTYEASTD